ncbi:MAG: YdaU family protein [Pseudomonadota bacterium]|nr:YdaU family protein [Pseudomonadota bacterium]
MNYYERYCGDYQRDTAHLSLAEHGAYTMLLDTYFSVEKPLPKEFPSLYRVCRAMTRIEQQAVKTVAEQFFPVSEVDGLRHNRRADREIGRARPKIEAARINGKKGGRPAKGAPRQGAGEGTQQKPGGLPESFEKTTAGITPEATRREPGGKAHQPQHQHQFHKNSEHSHTQANYPPEGQVRLSTHLPTHFSNLSPDSELDPIGETLHESGKDTLIPASAAGACCKTMIRHGVQGCNPHHPTLQALLQAGAVEEEFVQAARSAASRGKASFAYVVGTVKRQREEAAKLVLHQGRMPNRQELLEASNKAATEGWLPPELREIRSAEPELEEIKHENR